MLSDMPVYCVYQIPKVSGDGKVLLWDARDNDLSQPSRGAAVTELDVQLSDSEPLTP